MATVEIIEDDDPGTVKVIPPWKSHINPDIPLPKPDSPDPKPKKAKRQKQDKKPVQRYMGLPTPMITRSKSKQTDTSISTLNYTNSLEKNSFDLGQKDGNHDQFLSKR